MRADEFEIGMEIEHLFDLGIGTVVFVGPEHVGIRWPNGLLGGDGKPYLDVFPKHNKWGGERHWRHGASILVSHLQNYPGLWKAGVGPSDPDVYEAVIGEHSRKKWLKLEVSEPCEP